MSTEMHCLSVVTKNEGCQILLFLENLDGPDSLVKTIELALQKEYRKMNDVAKWCFHPYESEPIPGDFKACHAVRRNRWLRQQAAKQFGWDSLED